MTKHNPVVVTPVVEHVVKKDSEKIEFVKETDTGDIGPEKAPA